MERKTGVFFQVLRRFVLITACGSFTKTAFIGVEIVFKGVSKKQRGNGEKQEKKKS